MRDTTGIIDLSRCTFPSASSLQGGLDSILGTEPGQPVVGREPNPYAAYYPSEILTCRFGGDSVRRLLMKYAPDPDERYGGHQTGPRYEQLVYEHVLTGRRWSVPAFLGCYLDPVSGALWSATEYLGGGVHPDKMYPQADGLGLAARWVGRFSRCGSRRHRRLGSLLHRYDAPFYRR